MKKHILERYEISSEGKIIIDVSVERAEDLFSYFDRKAHYLKKDLDQELVDYLIECVGEIGKKDFIIRISLASMPDEERMARVRKSIGNYFMYLLNIEKRNMRKMFATSSILFGVGLAILVISIAVNKQLGNNAGVVGTVFAEGLTIAAWVSLWEALANLLIQWPPHHRDIRLNSRIARSPVVFHYLQMKPHNMP